MMEENKYNNLIDKLIKRKNFLLDKKKKIENELKETDKKIKKYTDRIKYKEVEDTILLSAKVNLKASDIKKILSKEENINKLKEMLNEGED
jgi:hypothetical protein